MADLTLTLDDDTLRRARIRALEQGTSVDALVRDYLQGFAEDSAAEQAIRSFLEATRGTHAGSGPQGRTWTREELYEQR